ncbi:MAG: septum formation family protein [Propionibacteriaceae bacterium]|jgi:hypothetical protein|nr:septum formation family protein [Propionibacteriaceae bacterium]
MRNPTLLRRLVAGLAAVSMAGLLGACSLFGTSPVRGEDGDITSGGDLDVFSVAVGDCFIVPDGDTVSSLAAMPCNQAHNGEIIGKFDVAVSTFDEDAIDEEAFVFCGQAAAEYIGPNWESTPLDVTYFSPTEGSWDNGDREILCFGMVDGLDLTDTIRGIGA